MVENEAEELAMTDDELPAIEGSGDADLVGPAPPVETVAPVKGSLEEFMAVRTGNRPASATPRPATKPQVRVVDVDLGLAELELLALADHAVHHVAQQVPPEICQPPSRLPRLQAARLDELVLDVQDSAASLPPGPLAHEHHSALAQLALLKQLHAAAFQLVHAGAQAALGQTQLTENMMRMEKKNRRRLLIRPLPPPLVLQKY